MFKPFSWMFKTENFKKRFWQLFITFICFYTLSIVVYYGKDFFAVDLADKQFTNIVSIILYLTAFLIPQGYFWELTSNIISRKVDIVASNVYSGKIKQCDIIELPEFKIKDLFWRGIASIVASFITFAPFILLMHSISFTEVFELPILNIEILKNIYFACLLFLIIVFLICLPGLLWNYSYRNSIVAGLNIFKAIYLLETYPLKYITNTLTFIVFYIVNCSILIKLDYLILSNNLLQETYIVFLGLNIVIQLLYIYSLHVYAYLLGTIAPPSEG